MSIINENANILNLHSTICKQSKYLSTGGFIPLVYTGSESLLSFEMSVFNFDLTME